MTPEDIYRSAASHNGRHLLRQRYRKTEPWEEPTELDREYEACQSLVYGGQANWLAGRSAPGIELTGKPLNEDSMTDQPTPPSPEIEELRRQIDVLRGEVGALRQIKNLLDARFANALETLRNAQKSRGL